MDEWIMIMQKFQTDYYSLSTELLNFYENWNGQDEKTFLMEVFYFFPFIL